MSLKEETLQLLGDPLAEGGLRFCAANDAYGQLTLRYSGKAVDLEIEIARTDNFIYVLACRKGAFNSPGYTDIDGSPIRVHYQQALRTLGKDPSLLIAIIRLMNGTSGPFYENALSAISMSIKENWAEIEARQETVFSSPQKK
ncbi:MAG: hypothetical protein ACLGHJ_00825 [Gammaproteobacteria bacterium]